MSKNQKSGKTAIDPKSIKSLFIWAMKSFPKEDRKTVYKAVCENSRDQSKSLWATRKAIEDAIIATHPRGRWCSSAVKFVSGKGVVNA